MDSFLLTTSHAISKKGMGRETSVRKASKPQVISSSVKVEQHYTSRYKDWWASQFSTSSKHESCNFFTESTMKSGKKFTVTSLSCCGIFWTGFLTCSLLTISFTSTNTFQKSITSCQRDVDSIRRDLTSLQIAMDKSVNSKKLPENESADVSEINETAFDNYFQQKMSHENQELSDQDINEVKVQKILNHLFGRRYGVNWLLRVNGASILNHSKAYCPDSIWFCSALISLGLRDVLPIQLSPDIILEGLSSNHAVSDKQGSVGDCWAMNGSKGFVDFLLNRDVLLESIIFQNPVPESLVNGGSSAIKEFRLWGSLVENASQQDLLEGKVMLENRESPNYLMGDQEFKLPNVRIRKLRLEVLSNHGHPLFTCIYQLKLIATT